MEPTKVDSPVPVPCAHIDDFLGILHWSVVQPAMEFHAKLMLYV